MRSDHHDAVTQSSRLRKACSHGGASLPRAWLCPLALLTPCDPALLPGLQVLGGVVQEEAVRRDALPAACALLGVPPAAQPLPCAAAHTARQGPSPGVQGQAGLRRVPRARSPRRPQAPCCKGAHFVTAEEGSGIGNRGCRCKPPMDAALRRHAFAAPCGMRGFGLLRREP